MATQQGIKSLERGIHLFRELRGLHRAASLREIAKIARMDSAKAHRYCVSLERVGLLQKEARGIYRIGPLGFSIDSAEGIYADARELAAIALPELVKETGETAFAACWGHSGPRILDVFDADKPITIRPTTKGDLPLLDSATGRIFAAYINHDLLRVLIGKESADLRLSDRSRTARYKKISVLLRDVRQRGLARTTGERYPGLISFSAPVFDGRGKIVLALTSFGISENISASWNGRLPNALRKSAENITKRLGGSLPGDVPIQP